jgi:hypothetical protein
MNPFLQAFWPDVHTKLIAYIADAISDQLPFGLKARSEETVLLASQDELPGKAYSADVAVLESWKQGIPPQWQPEHDQLVVSDLVATEPLYCIVDEQTDRWIEISDPNGHIITVIEVLSPANKDSAREKYWAKRHSYLCGGITVVEIDLLRGGYHVVNIPQDFLADKTAPYITCVTRSSNPSVKEYYQTPLRARLPNVRIPLRPQDPDAVLALQPLVDRCYRMGGYWNEPHTHLPGPPLSSEDTAWVTEQLKAAGFSS